MKNLLTLLVLSFAMHASAQPDEDMLAGMTALRSSDHDRATSAFSRVLVSEPSNAKAWYYRAVSRAQAGDAEGAVNDLDRTLSLTPDDVHALIRRAEASLNLGWTQLATTDLDHLLTIRNEGPVAEHALLLLGQIAVGRADLPAAKAHYDRLIRIAPHNAYGWVDRGIVHLSMAMPEEAVSDLEHALALDPTLDQAYGQLALAYHRLDRRQDACHAWHQALAAGDQSVQETLLIFCE